MRVRNDFMWATLVHIGTNMWFEENNRIRSEQKNIWKVPASAKLRFDRAVWDRYLLKLKQSGVNTLIIDVAEALQYKSYPELATEGAWSREEWEQELSRLDNMGFEVVPKLNFSTTHDVWLGRYAYMVSTEEYYDVCKAVIDEVADIFKSRFIHIGMDEEGYELQKDYNYAVVRHNEQWWHDLRFLADCVEKNNARAVMWSDYAREHTDEYIKNCPKSIVQCVWYYGDTFGDYLPWESEIRVRLFKLFDREGFDMLPAGSIVYHENNFELLCKYCRENISKQHLLGFLQTTWDSVEQEWEGALSKGCDTVKTARESFEGKAQS